MLRLAASARLGALAGELGLRRASPRAITTQKSLSIEDKIDKVGRQLEMALEGVKYIEDSAAQLLLETDPSARQPREYYVTRYQRFALQQLTPPLATIEQLRSAHSREVVDGLLYERQLQVLLADSMLARDNLARAVECAEHKGDY